MKPLLALDTTALSHFARAVRLEALQHLAEGYHCVTPTEVVAELARGASDHPAVARAMALPWVEIVELETLEEIVAFARIKAELGGGAERNNGEAAVLAWITTHGGSAIIDERAARGLAERAGLVAHGTLWLIINGVRGGELSREVSEEMVDELAATGMRLPVDGAGLFAWAYGEGLLP